MRGASAFLAAVAGLVLAACHQSVDSLRSQGPMFKGEARAEYKQAANCWAQHNLQAQPTVLVFEETRSASVTTVAPNGFTSHLALRQSGPMVVYELYGIRPVINLGGATEIYSGFLRSCGLNGHGDVPFK